MNRKLRVDYSTEGRVDGDDTNTSSAMTGQSMNNGGMNAAPQSAPTGPLPLPPGKELPPGVSAADAISRTLNTLPPSQLLDILSQMKSLATNDPARATELLQQAPQLAYAIFQALLLMGLVSPDAIHSVVDTSAPAPPTMQHHPGATTVTPPITGAYAPPVAPVVAPAPAATMPAAPAAAPQQDPESLMQAVMNLPPETIDQLPEAERQQILALRASFMAQRR